MTMSNDINILITKLIIGLIWQCKLITILIIIMINDFFKQQCQQREIFDM